MHLVLTHEQADFDALASMLGAYLLYDEALPVLPRRLNRNVRAFLTLYGAELPYVDPRDLPSKTVERVTLVDTQALTSIKGMTKHTKVHVIDHHPLREDLPPDWEITVSGTGANTTVFVETLHGRDLAPSGIQATLLLLGIYEDTGSLTYSRTTPRDLRAAGYLLEHGASLQIAADFLNHPLSPEQQVLYDRLRAGAETRHVNGHTVVIACADLEERDEELSTIAHKLRDLLDPEALFVLIKLRGGVQLIARSTSDDIDVAAVAARFGGGGHERAAAALIKERTLESLYQELVTVLPEEVLPPVTVAQIMSLGPQTLSLDTPVQEAARRMQRYGYEGYPVVDRSKRLVGLLTRRAVDRAVSHQMTVTVQSLMDAGEYTVTPQDSVEHLQRLMTESGWGQIPVVDREGAIVGIVTRTDLLITLAPQARQPTRRGLAERLDKALPAGRLALLKLVASRAQAQRTALYIVGGFVRDLLMERPSLDFDLVVEGDAVQLAKTLAADFGGRVISHARFGTAKWLIAEGSDFQRQHFEEACAAMLQGAASELELPPTLDFVSARTEFYTYPTALPTVESGSIKLDLHRRDFTINTLALRLDGSHYGELQDYWGGLADLRSELVRVLHSLSFVDDPTRILRAVRFEQRFSFQIEKRTVQLLREALPLLDRISGERIRHELDLIIAEPRAGQMLSRLAALDILAAIHSDLTWDDWLEARLERLQQVKTGASGQELTDLAEGLPVQKLFYVLWLLRLSPGRSQHLMERLRISSELRRLILSACALWPELDDLVGLQPSKIVARLEDLPEAALLALVLASDSMEARTMLLNFLTRWRYVAPSLTGHDLRAMGLPPGPVYRRILSALRSAWLDGEIFSPQDEQTLLAQLLSAAGATAGKPGARASGTAS